jgi:phosphatidylserine decarboxylase
MGLANLKQIRMRNGSMPHQYIDRETAEVKTESLYCDRLVNFIYSRIKEQNKTLFHALTSSRATGILGYLNYDLPLRQYLYSPYKLANILSVDLDECADPPNELDSPRKFFERKIKYWQNRPLPADPAVVAAPADSRMLVGSFADRSMLFIKEKFFDYQELLGPSSKDWLTEFEHGDFAIFRLTPDKYHYNHFPVSGRVVDFYQIPGSYHSCNPGAVIQMIGPFSKNKRVVTIIDTDVEGGTGIGPVAMIEVVALMIGEIVQCYSDRKYNSPQQIGPGMTVSKGQPKSLFRPGSSVDVLIFQQGRVTFSEDIVSNMHHRLAVSRFSQGFGQPLVETEVKVRSPIGKRRA